MKMDRVFVYFPSSKDESATQVRLFRGFREFSVSFHEFSVSLMTSLQHYCGEDAFSSHPQWRVKLPNGSDVKDHGTNYVHDLTQPAVPTPVKMYTQQKPYLHLILGLNCGYIFPGVGASLVDRQRHECLVL